MVFGEYDPDLVIHGDDWVSDEKQCNVRVEVQQWCKQNNSFLIEPQYTEDLSSTQIKENDKKSYETKLQAYIDNNIASFQCSYCKESYSFSDGDPIILSKIDRTLTSNNFFCSDRCYNKYMGA